MSTESDADSLMRHARMRTKKSLFRWNPNYEGAADDYCKAAKIYASLNSTAKAINAWQEASQTYKVSHNTSSAGCCLESLGTFLIQNADKDDVQLSESYNKAIACFEDAAKLYEEDGKFQKQASVLLKAVHAMKKCVELCIKCEKNEGNTSSLTANFQHTTGEYKRLVQNALGALEKSWEQENTVPYKLLDLYQEFILQEIRRGDIVSAVEAEKRMLGFVPASQSGGSYDESRSVICRLNCPGRAAKAGLEVVVLCLSCNEDVVWARQEFDRMSGLSGFRGSSEQQAAAALLAAYEERDPDQLREVLENYTIFHFIMAEVSRMVKNLKIDSGFTRAPVVKCGTEVDTATSCIDNAEEEIDHEDLR